MRFCGEELILDNFRLVLEKFSVDIQDIVRSAILDGVDISPYIKGCNNSPYRLDQIRLCLKEGLDKSLFKLDGDVLYRIRQMVSNGKSIDGVVSQLNNNLSKEYLDYLLDWTEIGANLSGLNVAIIPKSLLSTFDFGIRNNFNMCKYNTGVNYSPSLVKLCLAVQKYGNNADFMLGYTWSEDVVSVLLNNVSMSDYRWSNLMSALTPECSSRRVKALIGLSGSKLRLYRLSERNKDGFILDDDCIDLLLKAFMANVDLGYLVSITDSKKLDQAIKESILRKSHKVSGRIIRGKV